MFIIFSNILSKKNSGPKMGDAWIVSVLQMIAMLFLLIVGNYKKDFYTFPFY